MLRKHINLMSGDDLKHLPFFSWNCITIRTSTRDVDLVIKDEYQMKVLLRFLIYTLNTLDGVRGSAKKILAEMNAKEIKRFKARANLRQITRAKENKII